MSAATIAALVLQAAVSGEPALADSGRVAERLVDDLARPLTGAVPQGPYEAGVQGRFAQAQNLQGPLDGAWFLTDAQGRRLFRIQIADAGLARDRLEGAWADLAASGAVDAVGFFDSIERAGGRLVFRFAPPGGARLVLELESGPGGYVGELRTESPSQASPAQPVWLARS